MIQAACRHAVFRFGVNHPIYGDALVLYSVFMLHVAAWRWAKMLMDMAIRILWKSFPGKNVRISKALEEANAIPFYLTPDRRDGPRCQVSQEQRTRLSFHSGPKLYEIDAFIIWT